MQRPINQFLIVSIRLIAFSAEACDASRNGYFLLGVKI